MDNKDYIHLQKKMPTLEAARADGFKDGYHLIKNTGPLTVVLAMGFMPDIDNKTIYTENGRYRIGIESALKLLLKIVSKEREAG